MPNPDCRILTDSPLYTFTFLPNDFLPDVRINYDGIIDIKGKKTLWGRRDLVHT